ncbi:MAG: cell division protein ZapA [bacterium]|nr:cell division protein ZapA [bacterium]
MSNSLTEHSLPDGAGAATPAASKVDDVEPAERTAPRRAEPEQRDRDLPEMGIEALSEPRDERDSKMASKATTSVDVEIFGSVYHVRGEQDQKYLRRLAAVVDGKMREISRHVPVVDSGKIAILAALNLADELLQCNHQQEGERVGMMEKVEELTGLLTEALDP